MLKLDCCQRMHSVCCKNCSQSGFIHYWKFPSRFVRFLIQRSVSTHAWHMYLLWAIIVSLSNTHMMTAKVVYRNPSCSIICYVLYCTSTNAIGGVSIFFGDVDRHVDIMCLNIKIGCYSTTANKRIYTFLNSKTQVLKYCS